MCRPHAREQLIHAERLRHIVVGAEIERRDLAGLVAAARQNDDGQVALAAADLPQQIRVHRCRVDPRSRMTRRGFLASSSSAAFAVGRIENVVAVRGETHPQQLANWRLVVDDQNPSGAVVMRQPHLARDGGERFRQTDREHGPASVAAVGGGDGAVHGLDEAARDGQAQSRCRRAPDRPFCAR